MVSPAKSHALGAALSAYREGYLLAANGEAFPSRRKQPPSPALRRAMRAGYDDGQVAYAIALAQAIAQTAAIA